jgi:hypothetical protein
MDEKRPAASWPQPPMESNNSVGRIMETEALKVAVVMQRISLASRWQPYQWRPLEIAGDVLVPGGVRCLRDDPADTRWIFTGFDVRLFSDEAEGYFLNIDAPTPCWFVMWRMEEHDGAEIAVPKHVTLSYNEAARLMDSGEQVETLPASAAVVERMTAFVHQYYRPEQKKKRRKPSFEGGAGVDQMAKLEGKRDGS